MTRSLLRIPGSKAILAERLIQMMPDHRQYVEVFGGTGVILFHKPPSRIETYNDLDSLHYNAFRVLQDEKSMSELCRLIALTPDAREQYEECFAVLQNQNESPVRRAWALLVCCATGFRGSHPALNRSWSVYTKGTPRRDLTMLPDTVRIWAMRFLQVRIENQSWEAILERYDAPDTLFVLDPPYHPETLRGGRLYRHELTVADHRRLVDAITSLQGRVMLCGYQHHDYSDRLFYWRREEFDSTASLGAARQGDAKRKEVVWMNYETDGSKVTTHKRLIARRFIKAIGSLPEAKALLAAIEQGQQWWKGQKTESDGATETDGVTSAS